MSDKKKGLLSGLKSQDAAPETTPSSNTPTGCHVVVVENDRGVWGCYVDERFVGYGGNDITVRELVKWTGSRPILTIRLVDAGRWFVDEFPARLEDLPDGIL